MEISICIGCRNVPLIERDSSRTVVRSYRLSDLDKEGIILKAVHESCSALTSGATQLA